MSTTRTATIFFGITLFFTACAMDRQRTADIGPAAGGEIAAGDHWAKNDFDLQRIGPLLERSHNPQEFETYLNEDDGINNLDLNGDGYADYLSVQEYYDRGPYERGLSLFDRFGPNAIQEIANIVFYREDPSWPGARILVMGNDDVYGDNAYYVTNWYDRPVDLISYVYSPHDMYVSPYYYGNYPPDYVTYSVVDTPVYVTRVQQFDPQPVFVYTPQPDFISKIDIKSPYRDKHFDQVFERMAKPTREQQKFLAENHPRPEHMKNENPGRPYIPPGLEKRADNLPPGIERRNGGLPPGQEKVHGNPHEQQPVAEKPHGHDMQRVTPQPRVEFHQPKQPERINVARANPPKAARPMPQPKANPQPARPMQMQKAGPPAGHQAPPAGHPGPPAQRGGGGGKKKG